MNNNLPKSFGRLRAEMDMAQAPKNNLAPLHLHFPEPKFRPGDLADFSDIIVPEVDANPRPFRKTNRAPWGGVDFEITFHVLAYAG